MPKLSPVSYKQLVKVFEADGFRCVRTEGDHMVFTKPGVPRPVVIPKYAAVPVFIIKNNLRTGGISPDRYFELLGQEGCPTHPFPKLPAPTVTHFTHHIHRHHV